jgi:hypothetical protein
MKTARAINAGRGNRKKKTTNTTTATINNIIWRCPFDDDLVSLGRTCKAGAGDDRFIR